MGVNWAKNVVYIIFWSFIGTMIFLVITWGFIWVNSNNLVQDRLSELVLIASEENCLSLDGTEESETGMGTYDNLLKASETSWLTFKTHTIDHESLSSDELSYSVGDIHGTKKYFNYVDAPQKGEPIRVELVGYLELPVFFAPNGEQRLSLKYEIKKSYVTMGLKFFKDK